VKKTLINFDTPVEQVRKYLIIIFRVYGFKIRWNGQFSGKAVKGTKTNSIFFRPFKRYYEFDFIISSDIENGTTLSMKSTVPERGKSRPAGNIINNRKFDKIVKELMNRPGAVPRPEKRAARMEPLPGVRRRKWKGTKASKALFVILIIFTTFLIFEFVAVFFVPSPDSQMSGYPGEPGWNDLSYFSSWIRNESAYDLTNICFSPIALDTITKADESVFLIIGLERVYSSMEVAAISRFLDRGGSIIVADDSDNSNVLHDDSPKDSPLKSSGIFYGDTLLSLDCEKHPKLVKADAHLPTEDGSQKYSIIFNEGTALERTQEGESLSIAVSSEYSWLDENGNEDYDPEDENMNEFELIRIVEFERGTAMYIADSSIFINDMWTRGENSRFLKDSIKLLIGNNGTIIMDESIHKEDSFIGNAVNFSVGTLGSLCNSYIFIGLTGMGLVGLGIVLSKKSKKIERKPHYLEVTKPILLELQDPRISFEDMARLRNLIYDLLSIEYDLEPIFFWEYPEMLEELIHDYMIHEFLENPGLFEEKYLDYFLTRCNSRWIEGDGLIRSERPVMMNEELLRVGGMSATGNIITPMPQERRTNAYIRMKTEPVEVLPLDESFDNPIEAIELESEELGEEEFLEIPDPSVIEDMEKRDSQTSLIDELFPGE